MAFKLFARETREVKEKEWIKVHVVGGTIRLGPSHLLRTTYGASVTTRSGCCQPSRACNALYPLGGWLRTGHPRGSATTERGFYCVSRQRPMKWATLGPGRATQLKPSLEGRPTFHQSLIIQQVTRVMSLETVTQRIVMSAHGGASSSPGRLQKP